MRDVGEMGEATFRHWCASVGLTANKADRDLHGWDFVVEFPFASRELLPIDMLTEIKCKFQVKSTDIVRYPLKVSLSNLRQLVIDPYPAFFIVFKYYKYDNAKEAFIIHVGNNFIERVLKKVRQADASGKGGELNKMSMTLEYDESNKVQLLNGDGLKMEIEKYIGNDYSRYVLEKQKMINAVGFEDGTHSIDLVVHGENNIEKLALCGLGKDIDLDSVDFSIYNKRFGIVSREPVFAAKGGKVIVGGGEAAAVGRIIFKQNKFDSGVGFTCSLYKSALFDVLSEGKQVFRFASDFFEAILYPFLGKMTFNYEFDYGVEYAIVELVSILKLFSMQRKKTILLEFHFEGKSSVYASTCSADDLRDFEGMLKIANAVSEVALYFGVLSKLKLSVGDMYASKDIVGALLCPIKRLNRAFKVCFKFIDQCVVDKKIVFLCYISVVLGNFIIGAVLSGRGRLKRKENECSVATSQVAIEDRIVLEINEKIEHSVILEMFDAIAKKYEEQGELVLVLDPEHKFPEII